jgi:photosystem II stability/assembly factor-like uncharacterized protein
VKKLFCMLIVALVTPLLGGCFDNGSSAPPPPWLPPTNGDGRVKLEWIPTPGVDYWLFTATDPSLTAFNWTGLPNEHAYTNAGTPFYMCGLIDDMTYYFATNGRTNGGPGGPSSSTISAIPYNASASSHWQASTTPPTQDVYGVGYTGLTTCSNNATSASGSFAAVGKGGAIFISTDAGKTWVDHTSNLISSDLYAVTGYAANQNNPGNPAQHWIAVGAAGTSAYSTDDGATWTVGNASSLTTQPLRSISHIAGTFTAVGDSGTILSTTDGITWISHTTTSGTTNNLNGVTHGSIYVAVGDNGTIVTSSDGNTWTVKIPTDPITHLPSPITTNLRQVNSFGGIIVAVGDGGTIVTSKDSGVTWYTQTLGSTNLVGVTAESLVANPVNPVIDTWLGVVPSAQFVVADVNGNVYTSVVGSSAGANGLTWSGPFSSGANSLNALVSSGFGYVAAGNANFAAYAF